jgi:hypothetical protein
MGSMPWGPSIAAAWGDMVDHSSIVEKWTDMERGMS